MRRALDEVIDELATKAKAERAVKDRMADQIVQMTEEIDLLVGTIAKLLDGATQGQRLAARVLLWEYQK